MDRLTVHQLFASTQLATIDPGSATSAAWIKQVERWFAELTRKQLQRGVHTSVSQLEADITAFVEAHNADLKPYRWTISADEILASVKRFCHRVDATRCDELSFQVTGGSAQTLESDKRWRRLSAKHLKCLDKLIHQTENLEPFQSKRSRE